MNATTIDSMFGVMLLEASVLAKATTGAAVVAAAVVVALVVVVGIVQTFDVLLSPPLPLLLIVKLEGSLYPPSFRFTCPLDIMKAVFACDNPPHNVSMLLLSIILPQNAKSCGFPLESAFRYCAG